MSSDLLCWCPKDAKMISLLEDSAVDTGQNKRLCKTQSGWLMA